MMRDFDDVDAHTLASRDRGEFEADKARADHHYLARLRQALAQGVGIGQGAQRKHAVELGAGHRKKPTSRPGGQNDVVAFDRAAGGQAQAVRRAVDRHDRLAGDQIDLLLLVEEFGPQQQFVEPAFTREVGFRQWRALVGQPRLVTDQHDAAGKTLRAQRRGRLETGRAGADDGDDRIGHQTCVSGR